MERRFHKFFHIWYCKVDLFWHFRDGIAEHTDSYHTVWDKCGRENDRIPQLCNANYGENSYNPLSAVHMNYRNYRGLIRFQDPSRNLGPPENALAAYSRCKCTSRHSLSTSSKTIREIDCQWAHSVRSSSLPIEHPKPPFDHKSFLPWPSVTFITCF